MHDILTGQKIGRWTIGEEFKKNNKLYYKCICDCDNPRIVYSYDLTSGKVTMCKECREKERLKERRKDYTNQVFGKLTVTKMIYEKYEKTKALSYTLNENEIIEKIQNILNP